MKKRIASIALSLAMCLTLLPTAAYAEDVSEGGAFDSQSSTGNSEAVAGNEEGNTALYSGSGTESDPYQISTADGFYAFAEWYNQTQHKEDVYAELTDDINLNKGFTFTESGYTGDVKPREWTPIGFAPLASLFKIPIYKGEFNGNGHKISGLYISEDEATALTTGLFGHFQGYLHDVKIVNSYISSKSPCTGAFAGVVYGKIENCTANAVVSSDAEEGYLNGTGGIVGNLHDLKSEVLNCTFSGSVSSDKNPYVGGIVGDNLYGYVAGCTNYGRVTSSTVAVGGIVGQNQIPQTSANPVAGESSVIECCINTGSISGTNSSGDVSVGGIVGMSSLVDGSPSEKEPYIGAIRNCLNTGSVNGSVAGGIAGSLETSTNVENCLNIGAVSGNPVGAIAGIQLSSCKIADSYYQEKESLNAVGQLGTSNGSSTPSENEKISDTEAKATESKISSGEISWKLNTNNGKKENSKTWAINAKVPTLASDTVKPTYKVVFDFPEGTDDVVVYTSADGTAEIPVAAQNMALTYQNDNETKIFTKDTVVTADMTVTVAEKQACTAPVFAKNTDTLTEETDDKAQFTLKEEPVSGVIFKVYSAETGGELVGTASYSGKTLTVTLKTIPTSNTSYYISMEIPNTTESARTKVVVNAYKKPASSSGGGGSSTPRYAVTVPDKTENGSLSVTPKNAKRGSSVTITATPDKGCEVDDIVAKDAKGNKLTLKDNGDGTYTFTMPASKVTIEATFAEKQAEPIVPEKLFADVSADDYYYEAVKWASENGVTGGIGENLFGAKLPCTRAQIVTFQWRAAGSPEPKGMSGFVDVSADAYYAKAVAWAVEQGIVSGTSATTFSPDAVCTRAQSVAFLYRAFGTRTDKAAGFSDVSADAYYADAVAWAVENGVASGIGGGLFAPDQDCARGQIVAFLYRAYQNK